MYHRLLLFFFSSCFFFFLFFFVGIFFSFIFLLFQCDFSIPFSIVSKARYFFFTSSSFAAYFMRYTISKCLVIVSSVLQSKAQQRDFGLIAWGEHATFFFSLCNKNVSSQMIAQTFKRRTFYECIIISTENTWLYVYGFFFSFILVAWIFVIQMQTPITTASISYGFISIQWCIHILEIVFFPFIYCLVIKTTDMHWMLRKKRRRNNAELKILQTKNFIIRTSNKNQLINGLETCTIIVLSLFFWKVLGFCVFFHSIVHISGLKKERKMCYGKFYFL